MYLRVATISDLLTADGKHIDQNVLKCLRSNSPTLSEFAYTWPNVPQPTPCEALIWYNVISALLAITQSNSRVYGSSIFKWDKGEVSLSKWTTSADERYIYEREEGNWKMWERQEERGSRRRGFAYKLSDIVYEVDQNVLPITVSNEKEGKRFITHRGEVITFEDNENGENNMGWILPLLESDDVSEERFAQQIIMGSATMVCDGSYKLGRSSASFTTVPEKAIRGSLTIPGKYSDQSSYRAELGGILSSIVYANKVTRDYNIAEGTCLVICDNKGALASSFGHKHINPRWKCYDLLCMIRFQIHNSPITWKHRHVKGHQDNTVPYDQLSIIAQANVDVDELAKTELQRNRQVDDSAVLQGQCWRLKQIDNVEGIQGNIENELRRVIYEDRMRRVWKNKFGIRRLILHEEWQLMKRVNKTHSEWEHLFAVKYATGIMATKVNMVRRKHEFDDRCPCCQEREDTDHILRCTSATQEKKFKDEIKTLDQYLMNITAWDLRGGIIELLEAFREQRAPTSHHNWSNKVIEAVDIQFDLGQRAFTSGLWVHRWVQEQDKFHKTQKTKKKGVTIIALMVQQVQRIVREMWYNRNDELHKNEQSRINKERMAESDLKIGNIFERKRGIPLSLIAPGDRKYFRRKIQTIKRMRLVRKERWIRDAELILNKYDTENNTEQIRRFRSFFMHRDDG